MTFPSFVSGEVLRAQDMNAVGLWLVKTQTVGAGVSSVPVTGAFSSDYANYFITWQGGSMSGDTALALRLGSTASGCYGAFIHTPNYNLAGVSNAPDVNTAAFTYAGGGNSSQAQMSVFLSGPNTATRTFLTGGQVSYGNIFGTYNGVEISTTQHTAFTLTPFSGTMTGGTIRVYGYRN
jgi:hypothetical protein